MTIPLLKKLTLLTSYEFYSRLKGDQPSGGGGEYEGGEPRRGRGGAPRRFYRRNFRGGRPPLSQARSFDGPQVCNLSIILIFISTVVMKS